MGSVLGRVSEETPKFALVKKTDSYELRKYQKMFVAETRDQKDKDAFWKLAGFIGVASVPQNKARESIAMTAPVFSIKEDSKAEIMRFLVPSKYTSIEQIPVPEDSQVSIREVPEHTVAVLTYSGLTDLNSCQTQVDQLFQALQKEGIKAEGSWTLCRYNSPFTLPWYRTNEIHIPVQLD